MSVFLFVFKAKVAFGGCVILTLGMFARADLHLNIEGWPLVP